MMIKYILRLTAVALFVFLSACGGQAETPPVDSQGGPQPALTVITQPPMPPAETPIGSPLAIDEPPQETLPPLPPVSTSGAQTPANQLAENNNQPPANPSGDPAGLPSSDQPGPQSTPGEAMLPTVTGKPTVLATPATIATATSGAAKTNIGDKASWISNSPKDKSALTIGGASWDILWRVKNTGTTTWTTKYSLRWYGGERMHQGPDSVPFPKDVRPGDIVTFTVPGYTPPRTGTFSTIWVLTNETGQNFYTVNLTDIRVIEG